MKLFLFGCIGFIAIPAMAAELKEKTLREYDRYIDEAKAVVSQRIEGQKSFLWIDESPEALARVRRGEVVVRPARGNGITKVRHGLIHNWIGTAFIPGASLNQVLAVVENYSDYAHLHPPIIQSKVVRQDGEEYEIKLRLRKGASFVTAILDTTSLIRYYRTGAGGAYSHCNTYDVREIEAAGSPRERELPAGKGHGYIWRADSFARFLERDGGVYLEFETVGLSADYPFMLGWMIDPIARSVGRASVADSLQETRGAVGVQLAKNRARAVASHP